MNDPDEQLPYQVRADQGRFQVVDEGGKVLLVCGDAANAEQYVVLMNQSYRRGYKAALRKAREMQ